jgi:hypothetical protein
MPGKTQADFKDSTKGFERLDRKFAAALTKIAHGELGRVIIQTNENAMVRERRFARGRELWFTIVEYYSTGRNAEVMFSLNDIQLVRMKGDNLEGFQNTWNMVLSGLPKVPDMEIQEHCYFEQIKGCKVLSEDIAHYERCDLGHPDRTYDFLEKSVLRYLQRTRQKKARDALSRGLAGNPQAGPGAAAPKAKPKAKAKGKNADQAGKGQGNGEQRGRPKGDGKKGQRSKSEGATRDKSNGGETECIYYQKGSCRNGDKCRFKHADYVPTRPNPQGGGKGKDISREPCTFFLEGRCTKGDKCPRMQPGCKDAKRSEESRVGK